MQSEHLCFPDKAKPFHTHTRNDSLNLAQLFYKLFKSSFSNGGRSISQNGWDSMKGDKEVEIHENNPSEEVCNNLLLDS